VLLGVCGRGQVEGGFNALLVPQDGDDPSGRKKGDGDGDGPPLSLRERLGREMLEVGRPGPLPAHTRAFVARGLRRDPVRGVRR
jgi:hypothetical protein